MLFVLINLVKQVELCIPITLTRKKNQRERKAQIGPVINTLMHCTLHHKYLNIFYDETLS